MSLNIEENFVLNNLHMQKDIVKVVRAPQLLGRVVFVGGHPGCGKTMLTPIVGSFQRVEIQKFNYALEYICQLSFLEKVGDDVANVMIRMLTDLDIYNMMMSREVNFRFKDLSSVFKNPGMWRYFRRLFHAGDAEAVDRIKKENPILQITMHNLLTISAPLFKSLGDRLRILEMVRHPLYMIKQWHCYIDLYGKDAREFTIWFEHKGKSLPFFALGWEDLYSESNAMDKVIYSIERLSQLEETIFSTLSEDEKKRVLIIPFEQFVIQPWPFLKQMESLLETPMTSLTRREMKKQKVPRKKYSEGLARPIYKKNGWQPPQKNADERQEFEERRLFAIQQGASQEGMKILDRLCSQYEQKYLQGMNV